MNNYDISFLKSDLENGDVCVLRNGVTLIFCSSFKIFIAKDHNLYLEEFYGDLVNRYSSQKDIMRIYRPKKRVQCGFNPALYEQGELVYLREYTNDR